MRIFRTAAFALAAGVLPLATGASAYEAGDILLRFGPATVAPDASSDPVAGGEIDLADDTQLGVTGTYMVTGFFGVELLASTPFKHNIFLEDSSGRHLIGETRHLPPTLMAQLHLPQAGKFRPYIGAGMNYTLFSGESLRDPNSAGIPASYKLELEDSSAAAAELGVDVALQGDWFLNAAVWRLDLETTATIEDNSGNESKTDIQIDPVVWMLGVGRAF